MTKYTIASRRAARQSEAEVPPIWRGIGCLLILFVPLMSYFLATLILQIALDAKWPLPYQLMGYPVLPPAVLKVTSLSAVWTWFQAQANLYALLLFTIVLIVVIGGVLSYAYAVIYKYVGPPRYGPLDAPPPKMRVKQYKR